MVGQNKNFLQKIISLPYIKSVLEIGSGKCSTRKIRKELSNKQDGHCLSLEDKDFWHNKMLKLQPNDSYGNIIKTSLIWDNNRLFMDFSTKEKFDFILIDGPAANLEKDKYICDMLYNFLSDSKVWIRPYPYCGGGGSSCHMLEYILPFFHANTVAMVDYRLAAVYYYIQQYYSQNIFDFYIWNTPESIVRKGIHKKTLKNEHFLSSKEVIRQRPTICTLICFKNNQIISDLMQKINYDYISAFF